MIQNIPLDYFRVVALQYTAGAVDETSGTTCAVLARRAPVHNMTPWKAVGPAASSLHAATLTIPLVPWKQKIQREMEGEGAGGRGSVAARGHAFRAP